MLTRTQALEGGANVTCISKVRFTYRLFIRLTILATTLQEYNMKCDLYNQLKRIGLHNTTQPPVLDAEIAGLLHRYKLRNG
jgi:hypothetical protein